MAFARAIIVGASSGIGEELARLLARKGCRVALVARREDELRRIADAINAAAPARDVQPAALVYVHDVTDYDDVPALLQTICRDLGGLDLFIYSSGVMPSVAADEYNFDKDRAMVEVNVLGAIAWVNEAARRFEIAREGTLVGISSVSGDRGRRSQPVYCATKAALDTYLEAVRNRIARFGVRVITIKPGPIDTSMTRDLGKLPFMIPADEAARQIYEAMERGDNLVYVPGLWRPIMALVKAVPSWVFRKLNL